MPPSPLFINEILALILAFLPRHDLPSAALVCHRWYGATRRVHPRVFACLGKIPMRSSSFVATIDIPLHILPFLAPSGCHSSIRPVSSLAWPRLIHQALQSELPFLNHLLLFSSLDLALDHTLAPFRTLLPRLASLSITNTWLDTIQLDTLLDHCPLLEHLALDSSYNSTSSSFTWTKLTLLPNPEPSQTRNQSQNLQSQVRKLKRLSLHKVRLTLGALEHLLRSSPALVEFLADQVHLDNLDIQGSILAVDNPSQHLAIALARCCPRIRSIQLDLAGVIPTANDHSAPWCRLPAAEKWTLAHLQILPHTLKTLSHTGNHITSLQLTSGISSSLTRLDLASASKECSARAISTCLHAYLCESPHLRHLWVTNIVFEAEFMDINTASKKVWACRNLQTLQLKVGPGMSMNKTAAKRKGSHGDDTSARHSRVLFAYLSQVCPQLEHLHLTRAKMNLELEGGLCYLSALESLQTLILQTVHFQTRHITDLNWICQAKRDSQPSAPQGPQPFPGEMRVGRSITNRTSGSTGPSPTKRIMLSKNALVQQSADLFNGMLHRVKSSMSSKEEQTQYRLQEQRRQAMEKEEKDVIQRLHQMEQKEGVTRVVNRMGRPTKALFTSRSKTLSTASPLCCWPELETFVVDALKYSGVSPESLTAMMAQSRPMMAFRAFS